jgi:hypothetical protein
LSCLSAWCASFAGYPLYFSIDAFNGSKSAAYPLILEKPFDFIDVPEVKFSHLFFAACRFPSFNGIGTSSLWDSVLNFSMIELLHTGSLKREDTLGWISYSGCREALKNRNPRKFYGVRLHFEMLSDAGACRVR